MNGIDAWKALKDGLIVTLRTLPVRAHDGNMQVEVCGVWQDMTLNEILTETDFEFHFPENLPPLPEVA